MSDDYYALLGVEPDATEEAILRAYRERVAEHHPDVSDAEDAEETFRRLNRAKDVLTDEERRREYDLLGHRQFLERAGDEDRNSRDSATRPETEAGFPSRPDRSPNDVSAARTPDWATWRNRGESKSIDMGGLFGPRGHLDLRSFLRPSSSQAGGRAGPRRDQPSAEQAVECPKCRGRGRFVHDFDTGLGRRRRIEPCERCGGEGTVDR